MIIDKVQINCNYEISEAEARTYFNLMKKPDKMLKELDIDIDGEDVNLRPHYDTIVRVRRITGYLSNVNNFNAAKKSEQSDRVKHFQ